MNIIVATIIIAVCFILSGMRNWKVSTLAFLICLVYLYFVWR